MVKRSKKGGGSSRSSSSSPKSKKPRGKEPMLTEEVFRQRLGLSQPPCRQNECQRNRDDDPFCLCRLGEPHSGQSPPPPISPNGFGTPAGLENLGNTCYLNSYLQTLFHILPVRRTLFAWRRPPFDQAKPDRRYDVVEELQRLFARLQASRNLTVSPDALVKMIGLNAGMQHDVQEFSMIFLDQIDQVTAERKGEEKLQSLFTGRCSAIVKCRGCQGESVSEDKFSAFGLTINEMEDVNACLKLYFADEKIDDYACDRCKQQGPADKRIQVKELPRFLNLYFQRYFYDKDAKERKKLTHAVSYPALLDLRPFLPKELVENWGEQGCCYVLKAVLIHRGDAHSGHYVARIRVEHSSKWYTFDDESVTPYEFKEKNLTDAKGAYLLVYEKLKDLEKSPPSLPEIPEYIDVRETDPSLCGTQLRQLRRCLGETGPHRFLANLKVQPTSCIIFLPTEWLITVLRTLQTSAMSEPIPHPDLAPFVCPHRCLGNMRGLKAVDGIQAGRLLADLGSIPRPCHLDGSHFCVSCTTIAIDEVPRGDGASG